MPAPPVPVTSVESYTSLPRVVPSTQSADHPSAEPVSVHDYTVLPPVAPSTSNEYTFNVRMDSLEAKAGKVKGGLLGAQFGSALNIKVSFISLSYHGLITVRSLFKLTSFSHNRSS